MNKSFIFVVMSFLIIASIYSSSSISDVFGAIKTRSTICAKVTGTTNQYDCCYEEYDSKYPNGVTAVYCADCWKKADGSFACNDYDKIFFEVVPRDNIDIMDIKSDDGITNDTKAPTDFGVLKDGGVIKDDTNTNNDSNDTNVKKDLGRLNDGGPLINPGE